MKLKAVNLSPGANFLPELNDAGDYWIADEALTEASPFITVNDRIGGRLLGAYPDNFEIIEGTGSKGASKKTAKPAVEESEEEETFSEEEGEKAPAVKPAPAAKSELKNKMAEKYNKNASTEES